MSTPRHEPRQHARPGRDPGRDGAVVRQRLRAVAGSGRPALAWHPATAALPRVDPPETSPVRGERWSWEPREAVDVPASDAVPSWHRRPGAPGDPGSSGADGWLPSRPAPEERAPALAALPSPPAEVAEGDEAVGPPAPGGTARSDDEAPAATVDGEADGEVARLRRRAAQTAASAYTAAHGHPTAHSGFGDLAEEGGRRWALRPRTAITALVVVLLVAVGVAALRAPAGGVEPMARVDAPAAAAAAGDGAPAGSDASAAAAGGAAADGEAEAAPGPGAAAAETPGGVVVHVVGQVAAPGLVTVTTDARVADALDAAGGATPEADLAALNLARAVTDGEQIHVPRPGEAVAAPPPASPGAAATGGGGAGGAVVDLNSADAAALDTLPGIGPVLAERIVAWRDENGPFTAVDELGEVSGIGPAVLEDVRDLVRV